MTTSARLRHACYERPSSRPRELRMRPRLASWDAAATRSQQELSAYLADTEDLLREQLAQLNGHWVFRLDVGVPPGRALLEAADLDNYLYPLTRYLTRVGGPAPSGLVSVWCTKQHAETSSIRVAPACRAAAPRSVWSVQTTASATTTAFKQHIYDAVRHVEEVPEGPVRVEISYLVGKRNWINLWKPTIDALDPLLGRTISTRSWHPRDGRITELGLHLGIDSPLRYDVDLCVVAEPASPRPNARAGNP